MKIENLIDEYGTKKAEFDKLKKELEKLSAEIKQTLGPDSDAETGKYKVKVVSSERTSMNEDKAISLLKGTNIERNVVKTKLYVDTDALETLIYRGAVDNTLIAKLHECIEVKKIESLRISAKKGG